MRCLRRVRRARGQHLSLADFAYDNGYLEPFPIAGVGPFCFEGDAYEAEMARAVDSVG